MALAIGLVGAVSGMLALYNPADELPASSPSTTTSLAVTTTTGGPGPSTTVGDAAEPDAGQAITEGVVAVKIDNSRPARPQWGLAEAPLLVEHFVEGPISRFTAVIPTGLTGMMGPVRSLRPVDAALLPVISRAVVSSGGRPFVLQDVEATGVQNIVAGDSSLFASVGNPDPYDTFVDLALLDGILSDTSVMSGGIPVGDLPAAVGAATELVLPFEGTILRYDAALGYTHERAGEPFVVLDTSGSNPTQLAHDTVVVIFAAERSAGYSDVNDVPVMTYDVIGGGDLLVLHEGDVYSGTWRRDSLQDGFELFDITGNSFGLPRGSIYMAIVPRDSQVSYR